MHRPGFIFPIFLYFPYLYISYTVYHIQVKKTSVVLLSKITDQVMVDDG